MSEEKKLFCLDTNIILDNPNVIYELGDNDVCLSSIVLEELDKKKNDFGVLGHNARKFMRMIDRVIKQTPMDNGILELTDGTSIIFHQYIEKVNSSHISNDDKIISQYHSINLSQIEALNDSSFVNFKDRKYSSVKVLSNDINFRIKCLCKSLEAEELKVKEDKDSGEIYTGQDCVAVPKSVINHIYDSTHFPVAAISELNDVDDVNLNQMIHLVAHENEKSSALCRVVLHEGEKHLVKVSEKKPFEVKPRNKEQRFAVDLLLDESVNLVTMTGKSGTGKTLMAIASALELCQAGLFKKKIDIRGEKNSFDGAYKKIIIIKALDSVGGKDRDLGALPGTLEEKVRPYMQNYFDNLEYLLNDRRTIEMLMEDGLIEVGALATMRGRSIRDAIVLFDEVQNLSRDEVKAFLTRAGENTKFVLMGDIEQIDNIRLDKHNNGLTYVLERMKDQAITGHIRLNKGERSNLATLAADLL